MENQLSYHDENNLFLCKKKKKCRTNHKEAFLHSTYSVFAISRIRGAFYIKDY